MEMSQTLFAFSLIGGAHVGPDLQIRDRGQSRLPEQDGEAVIELLVVDFV